MKQPVISCIMPTYNRRPFIQQSIKYFLAQDYENKELVIIDDGEDKVADLIPFLENVHYISISERCSLGMKRNIAVSFTKGEIICHWDDDDYYGSQRLSKQAEPILGRRGIVASAMKMSLLLNALDSTLWKCSEQMNNAFFLYGVRAGTLMYLKSYWHGASSYQNQSRGEDVAFLSNFFAHGLQVARIDDPASYICVRHDKNVTADLDTSGWEPVLLKEYLSEEDRAFYFQLRAEKSAC